MLYSCELPLVFLGCLYKHNNRNENDHIIFFIMPIANLTLCGIFYNIKYVHCNTKSPFYEQNT